MDKFDEQEMKKIRPIIREWFGRLINKNVMGKKHKIIRDIRTLFEIKNLRKKEKEA